MTSSAYQRCVALLRQIEDNRKSNRTTFFDTAGETLRGLISGEDKKRKSRQEADTWRDFSSGQDNLS